MADDAKEAALKVLSAGAVKRGVAQVARQFEGATGTHVVVEFNTAPQIRKRVAAGEAADVLVAPPAVMDELQQQGKIRAETRGFVGRSRMGVVVHAAAPVPPLGDTEAFRQALRGAAAVVHNKASSGLYAAKLLEQLGLAGELASRIVVVDTGAAIMEYVAAQPPGTVGLAQISEIMVLVDKGCAVKLAAPLPDAIQNITTYDAAAAAGASEAARRLAREFTSDAARKIFAATGIH
jgi:molybdate transport system substrate-binding protein